MIDLSKSKEVNLPEKITVNGKEYKVHTDFKWGIAFIKLCESNKPKLTDFDSFYCDVYNIPVDRQAGINELIKFYNPSEELPNRDVFVGGSDYKPFDYVLDSSMIYAAFMQTYHLDLLECKNLHWYKFLALFRNLKDTRFNDVIGYRGFNPNDKSDYKKSMMKQRELWEIREEPDEETQAAIDRFNEQFK